MGRAGRSQIFDRPRSAVRPPRIFPRRLPAGDAAPRRQRRDVGHAGTAGHDRVGVRVDLPAHVLVEPAERNPDGRYATDGRTDGGAAWVECRRRLEYSWDSIDRKVSEHAADVSGQRLPAARLANKHRVGLPHECFRSCRLADVAQGPAHDQDGARLALGASRRRPAAVAHRLVHIQRRRQRSAWHGQHRHAPRELPARSGAALLDRSPTVDGSGARALPGVLHSGRLEGVRSIHTQSGASVHAELPVDGDQRPDRGVQSTDPPT